MEIRRAWAIYEWELGNISLDARELALVVTSESAADDMVENVPDGRCRTSVEVVVAVDGDECTVLGKWDPVRIAL